jgi:hypothetical protein
VSYLVREFRAGPASDAALAPLLRDASGRPCPSDGRASGLYADRRDARRLLLILEWEAGAAPPLVNAHRRALEAELGPEGAPVRCQTLYRIEDMSQVGDVFAALRLRVAPADQAAYRAWETARLRRAAALPGVLALALLAREDRPGELLLLGEFADEEARDRYRRVARARRGCPVPAPRTDTFVGAPLRRWGRDSEPGGSRSAPEPDAGA